MIGTQERNRGEEYRAALEAIREKLDNCLGALIILDCAFKSQEVSILDRNEKGLVELAIGDIIGSTRQAIQSAVAHMDSLV